MGNSVSGCFGQDPKELEGHRKMSFMCPTQFVETTITPSEKHDNKFYFIKNEELIDRTLAHFDETASMNEEKSGILDQILAELREQKNTFTIFPSYNSVEDISAVCELDEEHEESPIKQDKNIIIIDEKHLKPIKSYTMPTFLFQSKAVKEISQGSLFIEIQKSCFLNPQLLQKYKLSKPYVVTKIYQTEKTRDEQGRKISHRSDITKFHTPFAFDSQQPSWDEFFECLINDEKGASSYSVGFSLFYICSRDRAKFQIGEEQIFSLSSLLDQTMQIKQIDFKDPEYKGVLARVRIRLQFIHDQYLVKERLIEEIRAKIERLIKIRERHPTFQKHKKEKGSFLYSTKVSFSRRESEYSQRSSMHEGDEGGYYVA